MFSSRTEILTSELARISEMEIILLAAWCFCTHVYTCMCVFWESEVVGRCFYLPLLTFIYLNILPLDVELTDLARKLA